jgi:cation diffusion facilitator CzcD-associated flavoprotein CzcO
LSIAQQASWERDMTQTEHRRVAIVGTGFAGLGAAIAL